METKNYKPPIRGLPASLLLLALRLAGAFTNKITHIPSRQIINGLLDGVVNLIRALSDTDPNDQEQVSEAVLSMVQNPTFVGEMARNGRDYVIKNHSWKEIATKTAEIFQEYVEN